MNAIEWLHFLQEQRIRHNKVIFTVTELANASASSLPSVKTALQRLVARGVVERYADGRYGLPGAAALDDLVPSLDRGAYITAMAALYRHQIVGQAPTRVECFTNRRHNRSRMRDTSLGRVLFICVAPRIYSPPPGNALAGPEQALCDFMYLCRRQDLSADQLVTFRNLDRLDVDVLEDTIRRYPATVRRAVRCLAGEPGAG